MVVFAAVGRKDQEASQAVHGIVKKKGMGYHSPVVTSRK
jgi:hypothetical protein